MRSYFIIILIFSVFGCSNSSKNNQDHNSDDSGLLLSGQSTNDYARGFAIIGKGDAAELVLMDPWEEGEIFARYKISPPYKRWAVSSTTHIGFMDALGESDRIVGCTSPDRIYNEKLAEKFRKGEIVKIGSDMEFNFESVLGIEPDLILQTAFEGQKKKDSRFLSTDLSFVYILEWMEPHPLGRAEWIKVFGLLTGKTAEADSIFSEIKNQYNSLKEKVEAFENKPLVMIGNNFNGTWYMPGGKNFMCRFFEDAGFRYPYNNTKEKGSLALNFENVLDGFRNADVWLGVSAASRSKMLEMDSRYSLFDPFDKREVYSVNGRIRGMGNDYWESGVVYPDQILADLTAISYPEVFVNHKLKYYSKLEEIE